METLLLSAELPGAVERAAATLAAGKLVALPTETVYGLAADAANPSALAAVFEAKERPFFDPLIVHLPGVDWISRLALITTEDETRIERLTRAFWPGPLTILLPRRPETVPDLVTAGSALVALRISTHPVFRRVIERFGRPLAAPSANRFGRISPTSGAHAYGELAGRIPLVLEAGLTRHGIESTIVALQDNGVLRVLRHGPVTAEQLAAFGRVVSEENHHLGVGASAPGQTAGHYAPRTPLTLRAEGIEPTKTGFGANQRIGLLAFRRDRLPPESGFVRVEVLSESGDLREAAARLFAALRRLDDAGLDGIVAESVPATGIGRAIMERLVRAAAGSGENTAGKAGPQSTGTHRPQESEGFQI